MSNKTATVFMMMMNAGNILHMVACKLYCELVLARTEIQANVVLGHSRKCFTVKVAWLQTTVLGVV